VGSRSSKDGDEYVRFQSQHGLYLGATDPTVALDATTPSCRVVQGMSSTPNDNAFLLRNMCGSRTGGWSLPCVMSD
jgi:hypothetical protein